MGDSSVGSWLPIKHVIPHGEWIAWMKPTRSSSAALAITSVVPEARLSVCCP